MMLLGLSDHHECAMRIAAVLGAPYTDICVHQSPDSESRITLANVAPNRPNLRQ